MPGTCLPFNIEGASNDYGPSVPDPYGNAQGKAAIRSSPSPGKYFARSKSDQRVQLLTLITTLLSYSNPSSLT